MNSDPTSDIKDPPSKPQSHPVTTYRPLPPREYALGSEIRRADASFAPTLLPTSSLRRSATGSQYSWSSRGSGSNSRGACSWTGREGRGANSYAASVGGGGGGLSSTNITMTENSGQNVSAEHLVGNSSNRGDDLTEQQQQQQQHSPQHEQDTSAMGRISEEDAASTSGISSLKQTNNFRDSEENVEIFERSDVFERSTGSDSISYHPNSVLSADLQSSPNPGFSPYQSALGEESPMSEDHAYNVNDDDEQNDAFDYEYTLNSQQQHHQPQQQLPPPNKRIPHDQLPNPNSRLKLDMPTPLTINTPLAMADIKSPCSISTMDSESYHPEMAATARFGRLLQQCRELTETCEDSTMDGSDRFGSSAQSEIKGNTAKGVVAALPFKPTKLNHNHEIQTSGRVYNASEITMDPYIKTADFASSMEEAAKSRQFQSNKSFVSDISLGVDRMYDDDKKGPDYTETGKGRKSPFTSNSRGSPVSELSYSDRRGDEILADLTVKPNEEPTNATSAKVQLKSSGKPDFMRYLSNVTEAKDDDSRRSWLSYTDDERTPRNNPRGLIHTFKVPVQDGPNFKRRMASSGTTPQQSPQSSFYSTDFSDEGSGGLLVGFGKRRKSSSDSDSDSSSSSSGFSDSSDSDSDSNSDSSSSSESEEETEESEPSMPTIARSGLRLTHQQDDDVSALSFGGASALVVSAPPRVPLSTPKLLPEENSRSRLSESSSTPTNSLERAPEEKKESSPESEQSKRSSKSSGSGFLSAGGRPLRRSSLTGAEKLSGDVGSAGPSTAPRRATIGDLPQLEEESSQASSSSPLPSKKSISSRGDSCDEIFGNDEAIMLPTTVLSHPIHSEPSSNVASRASSRSSRSASVCVDSKQGILMETGARVTSSDAQPSPIHASFSRLSRSSKSSSSCGSKREVTSYNEALPEPASVSVLSRSSKSTSDLIPPRVMQSSGEASNEMAYQNIGQLSAAPEEKSMDSKYSASANKVHEHRHLKRVAEESSDIHSSDDFIAPLSFPNSLPTCNNAAYDDEISVTSSLSSVVSKARVSFQITCSTSVASALSDRSREETKSRGSFRKSASEMIAERQSSKSSIGSSSRDHSEINSQKQLESSVKSGAQETSSGDLYEAFPTEKSDEFIRHNRTETTRSHSTGTDIEIDSRKPWRTAPSTECATEEDSGVFSEGIESSTNIPKLKNATSIDDDNSALSEVVKSQAALTSMGLYNNDPVDDTDEMENAGRLPEKLRSVLPKHLSRTSTASSITEWDFSDQNKTRTISAIEPIPSESVSSSPAPSLNDLTPSIAPALLKSIDTSSRSGSTRGDHLSDGKPTKNPSEDNHTQQMVSFAVEQSEDSSYDELKKVESKDSPMTEDKREAYRKSMLDVANEMSSRLEKSFLARSQQQLPVNDFESRSYEDLSSASEEDAVLAYLREQEAAEEAAYDSHQSNELDISDIPEEKSKISEVKSRASSLLKNMSFRIKNTVMKPEVQEGDDQEENKADSAPASESEYVEAELRPIFPGSDRGSSGPRVDDSDVESGFPIRDGNNENNDTRNEEIETTHVEDTMKKAWFLDKEFYKSKYFLFSVCCILLIIIIVAAVAGKHNSKNTPSPQPTIKEAISPTSSSPAEAPTELPIPSVWVQVGNDIEGKPGEELGFSISTSEKGGRFIVGSRRSSQDNMKNRGAASIYEFDDLNGSYTLVTEIHGEQAGDQAGYSVSISKNGKRVAIGSLGSDKNGNNSGQVRIFDEDASTKEWVLVAEFVGEVNGSLFGTSVSLSQDGAKLAVGAPYYGSSAEALRVGKTYIYQETDGMWNKVGEPISGVLSNSLFGWSVSWSPDSMLLAIGAPGEGTIDSSGYVKVFVFESNRWSVYGKTVSKNTAGDRFGFSVWLGGNKSNYCLAIGAPGTTSNGEGSGYAGIYKYTANEWLPIGDGIHGGWGENLGYAVSLTLDANRMVVGVPNKLTNGLPAGEIQVIDVDSGSFVPSTEISGGAGEDFGVSVAISYDGRIVYGGATEGNLVRVLGEL